MVWDTETKEIARAGALHKTPLAYRHLKSPARRRFARTALSLPGNELLCVKEGYRTGLYRESTYHLFVEKKPKTQTEISRRLHNLGSQWEPYFHKDTLESLDLRRALLGDTLDWAYLDLCGTLNNRIGWWLRHVLAPNLSRGAGVAITVTRNWRTSKLMLAACDLLRTTTPGRKLVDEMYDKVANAEFVGNASPSYLRVDVDGNPSRLSKREGNWNHYGSRWPGLTGVLAPLFHDSSLEILALLQLLMPEHKFRVDTCVEYQKDGATGNRMTTVRLVDIRRGTLPPEMQKLADSLEKHLLAPSELVTSSGT